MFWTLLAAVFAGLAGAGIGLALRKLSRGKLPGGIIPICAGIAMIATTVAQEYAWYPNNLDDLPADAVVITTREQQAFYQPWTYISPWVRGFMAFAPSENVETGDSSAIYVVQAHIRERWQPAIIRPVLVDCDGRRRGDIGPDTEFNDSGEPVNVAWANSEAEDVIVTTVCENLAASG
ncbi:MAG: hypothetical protein AAGA70_10180 [Pseudomonadota bacterium]